MAFYLEKAIFHNRAPFEHLEIDFKKNGISVLTAINGKGKTTILSHIVDAFYELARNNFPLEFESRSNDYYRVSSGLDNINMTKPSFVYLRFINENSKWDYIDIRNKCTEDEYNQSVPLADKIPYQEICNFFNITSNIKHWYRVATDTKKILSLFKSNILTYFPAYRYELPSYLNDPYKVSFEYRQKNSFDGKLINPIEVISDMQDLSNWILDVLLDLKSRGQNLLIPTEKGLIQQFIPATESELWNNLNTILSQSMFSKKYKGTIRFGIGERNRGASRICIMNDVNNQKIMICPSIFNLSSGELSLMSIFGEILRQSDNLKNNIPLKDIQGIVLIDEVDKHLHITLQKEVLPKLFNLFPNIQFIVSSHSPFLNMGLADEASERSQIIDLDNNGIVCEPTKNDLFTEVYDMMVNENQRFADKYNYLETKTKEANKPVIITEGKTDWKHLKAALKYFKDNHEFEDIDVDILEYDFDFGDSKLHNILNQYKLFPLRYKVVGIFDCDEANGKKISDEGGIKTYANNIFGMSIPIPDFRNYNSGISIEFLYKDSDLKRRDANGRRLFITYEFNENGRLKENNKIGVKNNHDVKNYLNPCNEKIQADEVIDIEGNSLALSKEQFASNILDQKEGFTNIDYCAFRSIFERLRTILQL
ncbi:MAG: AAA family ATPase [Bacteroidales bacterium]|nr:AAA family ATPase [Bacteroidales bacterium]